MPAKKKPVKGGSNKMAAQDRYKLFAEAYLANGRNATDAAKKAGYSPKTAKSQGQRLLTHVDVKQIIVDRTEKVIAKAEEETGVSISGVLNELRSIVHSDIRKVFHPETGALLPPKDWPDDVAKSISSVKVVEMAGGVGAEEGALGHIPMYTKEVKVWDKNAAIDKAMKHLGLYEKDNDQKRGVSELSEEQLNAMLMRKAQELGFTVH